LRLLRKNKKETDDADRWLATYSDMITLLLVFFVMLYSMSSVDLAKFKNAAEGFSLIFGTRLTELMEERHNTIGNVYNPTEASPIVVFERFTPPVIDDIKKIGAGWEIEEDKEDLEGETENEEILVSEEDAELVSIARELEQNIREEGLQEKVNIFIEGGRLVIRIKSEGVLFDSGSAELKEDIEPLLDIIANSLKFYRGLIMVEGHTDDRPIDTFRYPSNWELSTSRAVSVLKYWIDNRMILPDDIVAAGYADTKPIESNDTESGRAKNRRVEILVLSREEASHITK
jgi:chemotaxis protein MotB